MTENSPFANREFSVALITHERQERISTGKIACALVVVLMPAGISLDFFVYRHYLPFFLALRLACAVLAGVLWLVHHTKFGYRHYRWLGIPIALLPAFFIAWMIYATDGPISPYYAGLNLILLAVSVVVRWNTLESLIAVGGVQLMYLTACILKGTREQIPIIFNNYYFLFLTGIIVVVGNHYFARLRLREFTLRYELDKNKKELEATNEKLVELDRLKGRFFANISHELRTPLTLLLMPLESLMHRFDHLPDDGTREILGTMHANGMRLLKLINDLLDLIRLESGRMEVKNEPLVVEDFIKALASAVRQVAEDKHIKWEAHVDPRLDTILTDRDKVEKIVLNLLFNALKFTPAEGRVDLHAERQGEEFVLIVSDTGVGIAKKSLPFIFDRFWQADSSSKRKFQGVGIGLALVKELVEMMHGGVAVESDEGRGTTFTVRLPYKKADRPARHETAMPAPEENNTAASEEWLVNLYRRAELFPAVAARRGTVAPAAPGHRPTVLVAEDEPDMRRFLKTELDKDYEVIVASDGLQALEKTVQFSPDIVLLDMMMPEIDGLEVCRELRKRETTLNIPVILLTARADEETKFKALEIGANDFLAKPFSSTELQARIRNLIESHHYQRKLSRQNVALTAAIEQIKETELQLVQSEKLASLGRLSAGIIHEINNPLNFTLTGLFALRNKCRVLAPEPRREYEEILDDVEEGIKRVRDIVIDLRTFTHPGAGAGEIVEVPDAVQAALRFLAGEWKDEIQVRQNLPAGQTVWANRNKLIHVLVNLLQNSLDALLGKKFADGEKPAIWIEGRTQDNRSLIVVRDNGAGIEPKILDKIFDPFFTTKDVGRGMGLGLSICYRIVQGYGGKISVRSERGKFCELTLDFPAKNEPGNETETNHGTSIRL